MPINKKYNSFNLNNIKVDDDPCFNADYKLDNSISDGDISIYFRNQIQHLIEYIQEADAIVGCVAWLTNEKLLGALKQLPYGVSIIVQKEDFLRPDGSKIGGKQLYKLYNQIKPFHWHSSSGITTNTICDNLSVASCDLDNEAIRCCGNHNKDQDPACPRMHNKFLIFGKISSQKGESQYDDTKIFKPYAVWTGSLNLTHNSLNSLENGVYIQRDTVAHAYLKEWANILAISEPLDWNSEWCTPQFRIGT